MQSAVLKTRHTLTKINGKVVAASMLMAANAPVFAALDTTAVQAGITGAETDGLAVGAMVIATVAAMAVVGVVIAMVKKL